MARHKRKPKTARREQPGRRPSSRDEAAEAGDNGPGERLQKVLAAAGLGSRRDCEELITAGRVEIDKQVVTELGTRVDPVQHEIRVDGEALRQPQRLYFAVNKPEGVVTTNFDPSGRPLVIHLVPTDERVFAVGRLDMSSEGLILVTNDGDFSNRITHPRYGIDKTYLVRVAGSPDESELAKLRKGVYLSDGFCRVQSVVAKSKHKQSTDLIIVLAEGHNRELRRILARVGHKVLKLKRTAVGPIKLADLPVGAWRRLMPAEIESLLALARQKRRAGKGSKKPNQPRGAKPVQGERPENPYQQQQALMAEPLSLDDLLRDNLDEGNLAGSPVANAPVGSALRGAGRPAANDDDDDLDDDDSFDSADEITEDGGISTRPGDVIDYEDDEPAAAVPVPPRPAKPPFQPRADRPREPAGRKTGGKRFAKPAGKPFDKPGGKKFGKPGGKRFAKPAGRSLDKPGEGSSGGKKFGKPAGKKFDKPGGKRFDKPGAKKFGNKKFGKPGGRGKNRP